MRKVGTEAEGKGLFKAVVHTDTYNLQLKKHIESIHEGVCNPCSECDYKVTTNDYPMKHIESIHKGDRYSCSQCEYKATNND